MASHDPIALRLQGLDLQSQVLVLASLSAERASDKVVTPAGILSLFHSFALPAPAKIGNAFVTLAAKKPP